MKLVVGLGNPGKEYQKNRHNAGKIVLDWLTKQGVERKGVRLIFPDKFMNNSGPALKKYLAKHKLKYKPDDLLVIHDDLDIDLGRAKLTFDRSSGGHKGVESVIGTLKTQKFWRLRVGVAPRSADYLLSDFSPAEQRLLARQKKRIAEGIELWLESPAQAQNLINQK